jgi:hypothetical protein
MSRQPTSIEATQAELEEDAAISGTAEADEIMEEAEEQEDGYSACFVQCIIIVFLSPVLSSIVL